MKKVIYIPNVDRDERIGSAFNHLFQVIQQTDNCCMNDLCWDLSNTSFFHPFFLAPLVIYKQRCEKNVICINRPIRITGYLDLVYFENPLLVDAGSNMKEVLEPYISKTYLPVCQFDLHIDLVLADDGITVLGSYVKAQKFLDEINGNDAEALRLANEGKSTKNLPNAENRGYGISSSKEMLSDGLHGSFFMLSGGAFHRHDSSGSVFVKLPNSIYWDGTIILMRIPVKVPLDFDYNKYTR